MRYMKTCKDHGPREISLKGIARLLACGQGIGYANSKGGLYLVQVGHPAIADSRCNEPNRKVLVLAGRVIPNPGASQFSGKHVILSKYNSLQSSVRPK